MAAPAVWRWSVVKTLARDAFLIAVIMVAVELVLQVWAPRYGMHLFDHQFTGGKPIEMNEMGGRGPWPAEPKAPGEVRILAVGDSVTFGAGVNTLDTWPFVLGEALHDRTGATVRAANTGLPSTGIDQIRVAFESDWSKLDPDIVGLVVTGNVVALSWIRRNDEPSAPDNPMLRATREISGLRLKKAEVNRLVKKLCLPSFLLRNAERALYHAGLLNHKISPDSPYGALFAHGWRQIGMDPTLADDAWEAFERDLIELRDAVQARGAAFVVAWSPSRFTISDRWIDNEKAVPRQRLTIDPAARLRAMCADYGIVYADAPEAIIARREAIQSREGRFAPMYIQADYTHLDAEGHFALATAMAEAIERAGVSGLAR